MAEQMMQAQPRPATTSARPGAAAGPLRPLIRPMLAADTRRLDAIHRACLTRTLARSYSQAQLRAWRHGWSPKGFLEAQAEGDVIFVAETAGRIEGFVGYFEETLLSLFVHPDAQGRGLGRGLLIHALADAAGHGLPLRMLKSAIGATGFYEAFGFRVVAPGSDEKRGVIIPYIRMERPARPAG